MEKVYSVVCENAEYGDIVFDEYCEKETVEAALERAYKFCRENGYSIVSTEDSKTYWDGKVYYTKVVSVTAA